MSIPESELIINSRGAIYHLNLRPDEIADTIFLVGDQDRVAKVSRHFDSILHKQQHREFISHTGYKNGQLLTVLSTGIGPDNIDIALNELDALANIDFETRTVRPQLKQLNIIRLGTSGGLQEDIPVDALVVSTHGLGFDNVMNYYEHEKSEVELDLISAFLKQTGMDTRIAMPYVFEGSESLIGKFGDGFYKGITVTAPGFYGPQGRELRLKSRTRHFIEKLTSFSRNGHRITNFEMESSAIFGLCKLLGHHSTSVNVVVANRVTQQYSKDTNAAVENMIERVMDQLF
jgi:uridine phosphorylase